MKEWRLKDCCTSISDGDHLAPPKASTGIPFITISNIDASNHIDFSDTLFVPYDYYDKLDNVRKAQTNDIIYSVVGSFGKPVLIKDNKPFVFQRHIAILRPNKEIVDSRYLYYIMLSRDFFMQADTVAIGAAQRTISLTALRNMKVNLPDLPTQKRIATILSRYDTLIENYQKQIKLLEEAAQRLYKEWFVDLRFPGHEKVKVVDGVPEGWERKKLGELVYDAGIKINKNDRCSYECYLPIDCLPKKQMTYFVSNSIEQAESSLISFSKGDIIFGAMRPYFHKVCIARHNGITRSTCFVLKEQKAEYKAYSRMLLFDEDSVNYATSISVGTTMPYVRWNDFKQMAVVVPTKIIADKFNSVVNEAIENCGILASQIRNLTESRDRMLVKLMSGEVEV
jgi:type I restriction enzyme S subunit